MYQRLALLLTLLAACSAPAPPPAPPRPTWMNGIDLAAGGAAEDAGVSTAPTGAETGSLEVVCTIDVTGRYTHCHVVAHAGAVTEEMKAGVLRKLEGMKGQPVMLRGQPRAVDYHFNFRFRDPR